MTDLKYQMDKNKRDIESVSDNTAKLQQMFSVMIVLTPEPRTRATGEAQYAFLV